MNPTWPESRFTLNDEGPEDDPLCDDPHMLREIFRLNELLKKYTDLGEEELGSNDETRDNPEKRTKPDVHEIYVQSTARSISSLKGRNISSNTTVVNIHSKTSLKTTGRAPRATTRRAGRTPNKSPRMNPHPSNKYETFSSPRKDRKTDSTIGKAEFRVSPKGTVHNRDIGDSPVSCPFELVELYSSRKGKNDSGTNRSTSKNKKVSMDAEKEMTSNKPSPKDVMANSENSVRPQRVLTGAKGDNLNIAPEKMRENSNEIRVERDETVNSNLNECHRDDVHGQVLKLRLPGVLVESVEREDASALTKTTDGPSTMSNKEIAVAEKTVPITEEQEEAEERTKSPEEIVDGNNQSVEDKAKNQNSHVNESSTDIESKGSKTTMGSESNSLGGSKTESSSTENAEGSKRVKSSSRDSMEGKFKIIIEKRANKTDTVDANSSNVEPMDNKKEEEFQDTCNEIMKLDARDLKHVTVRESSRFISCEEVNICRMLTKIHERLTSDWQRMERLQMKLQSPGSTDSANTIMLMLQLLDKTIARCKSYIHGSNDGVEAESRITKLLSRHIVNLVKVVNKNRITLEDQEKRVDQMQLEQLQGHHAPKKPRSILNEITLTSNYWANEISCIIETMSRLMKNVMTENEEKENVRSPRRVKPSQRRAFISSSANDTKQKVGYARAKSGRPNVAKRDSAVETQMSCVSNSANTLKQSKSKSFAKPFPSARSPKREKHFDSIQTNTDKKAIDNSRHCERIKSPKIALNACTSQYKQTVSRQKHRAPGGQPQPWKPGGGPVTRMPASNSVIILTQKTQKVHRENPKSANKRGNSMEHILTKRNPTNVEEGKRTTKMQSSTEEKQGNEAKKKPADSTKTVVPVLNIDFNAGDRSSISLKNNSTKPKSPRSFARGCHSRLRRGASDHVCPTTSNMEFSLDVGKISSVGSKILRELEAIIKDVPTNERGKNPENLQFNQLRNETSSISYDSHKSKLNEVPIDEEPTRDGNYHGFNITEKLSQGDYPPLLEDNQVMDKISEKSSVPISESMEFSSLTNMKDDSQEAERPETSMSCIMGVESMSSSNLSCQAEGIHSQKPDVGIKSTIEKDGSDGARIRPHTVSLGMLKDSSRNQEAIIRQKTDVRVNSMIEKNWSGQIRMSPHAVSLGMLKGPFCGQEAIIKNDEPQKDDDRIKSMIDKTRINPHAVSLEMLKGSFCDQEAIIRNNKPQKDDDRVKSMIDKTKINPHAISLGMLKDFLCEQGIGIELVNRAERYLKNKRTFLRRKSISFVNVPTNDESLPGLGNKEGLKETDLLEKRDTATSTVISRSNAYSQTVIHCKVSKSLQTMPTRIWDPAILRATETQTEVKARNACSMTDEQKRDFPLKNSFPFYRTSRPDITEETRRDEGSSNKECSLVLQELLMNKLGEESNESLSNERVSSSEPLSIDSSDSFAELKEFSTNEEDQKPVNVLINYLDSPIGLNKFNEDEKPMSIISSNSFIGLNKFSEENEEPVKESINSSSSSIGLNKFKEENQEPVVVSVNFSSSSIELNKSDQDQRPVQVISSEIVAALRLAEIRGRNVCKALEIYKRKLRTKRPRKRTKRRKVRKISKEEFLSRRGSVKVIKKKKDKSEVIEALRQVELISTFSKTSFGSQSEEENFESVGTRTSSTIDVLVDRLVQTESIDSVTVRDVRSLIEFLVDETSSIKLERTEVKSRVNVCAFHGNTDGPFSLFSREHILPLVYGLLCYAVFWCLQLTITCDVLS